MTNDVDTLMSRIDEINRKDVHEITPADIDDLIAYHRRNRARKASGEKIKKPSEDLSAVIKGMEKPAVILIKRRL